MQQLVLYMLLEINIFSISCFPESDDRPIHLEVNDPVRFGITIAASLLESKLHGTWSVARSACQFNVLSEENPNTELCFTV